VEASARCRVGVLALALIVTSCGGGGGGGGGPTGIGLEDLNQDGKIVILCFGDSITRGVGDGPVAESLSSGSVGYPGRLQPMLAFRTTLPLTVVNDGAPGERTATGVPRLRRDLQRTPTDYAILLEGTNDVEDGKINQALGNMQTMINAVFEVGAQPVLGTITPSCCAHKNQLPFGTEIQYNTQLRGMAAANMVPVIDFYDAFTNGPGPDGQDLPYDPNAGLIHVPEGLHPTPAGYDLMAVTAADAF
jgi:lysophospholipase L1-like esterase